MNQHWWRVEFVVVYDMDTLTSSMLAGQSSGV